MLELPRKGEGKIDGSNRFTLARQGTCNHNRVAPGVITPLQNLRPQNPVCFGFRNIIKASQTSVTSDETRVQMSGPRLRISRRYPPGLLLILLLRIALC